MNVNNTSVRSLSKERAFEARRNVMEKNAARLIKSQKLPSKFPPFKMALATLSFIDQNFSQLFRVWLTATLLASTIFLCSIMLLSWLPLVGLLFFLPFLVSSTLVALPTLRIALGALYKPGNQKKSRPGRFWWNVCVGGRLRKIGFLMILSWGVFHVSFFLNVLWLALLMSLIMGLGPVILLWGAIGAGVVSPISFSWRLAYGSWWRLLAGLLLVRAVAALVIFLLFVAFLILFKVVTFSYTSEPSSVSVMIVLVSLASVYEMICLAYAGLAFRFLQAARGQVHNRENL